VPLHFFVHSFGGHPSLRFFSTFFSKAIPPTFGSEPPFFLKSVKFLPPNFGFFFVFCSAAKSPYLFPALIFLLFTFFAYMNLTLGKTLFLLRIAILYPSTFLLFRCLLGLCSILLNLFRLVPWRLVSAASL